MAQTFTGRKRVRKVFGHIKEVGEMPNLIEVQKASYDQFLLMDPPKGGRPNEGLQAVFKSVFPISDFSGSSMLEFVHYEFEPPKYDVDECRQRLRTGKTALFVEPTGDGFRYVYDEARPEALAARNEVEAVLQSHPDVLEAAAVGVPHEVLGEDVAAWVVLRPGAGTDGGGLRRFAGQRLADYKVPRRVHYLPALPRNAGGKVLKSQLAEVPGGTGGAT